MHSSEIIRTRWDKNENNKVSSTMIIINYFYSCHPPSTGRAACYPSVFRRFGKTRKILRRRKTIHFLWSPIRQSDGLIILCLDSRTRNIFNSCKSLAFIEHVHTIKYTIIIIKRSLLLSCPALIKCLSPGLNFGMSLCGKGAITSLRQF